MHILIAEDNTALTTGLAYCLRRAGRHVELAADGQSALQALAERHFDLLILDYGLPVVHGCEVLRQVRARPQHLPVLLFSALDDAQARVERLGLAVDDFLAKPFSLDDFEARIAGLERSIRAAPADAGLSFGSVTCNPATGVVHVGVEALDLAADERALLQVLLRRAGHPISGGELARQLGTPACRADIVLHCVQRLGSRLEPSAVKIVDVRGLGWCLVRTPR